MSGSMTGPTSGAAISPTDSTRTRSGTRRTWTRFPGCCAAQRTNVRRIPHPASSELDHDKVTGRAHGDAVAAQAYPLTVGHQPTRHLLVGPGQALANYIQLAKDGLQPHLAAAGDLPRRRRDDRRYVRVSVSPHHALETATSTQRADRSGSDDNIEVRRNMRWRTHMKSKPANDAERDPRTDQLRCQRQEPGNRIGIRSPLAARSHDHRVRPNASADATSRDLMSETDRQGYGDLVAAPHDQLSLSAVRWQGGGLTVE